MWIRLPSMCCPSVPEAGDSISASSWRSLLLEQSAALSTKHTAAASWIRAWKRKPWMTRLFGRIYEPSTAARGVATFISSLADSPASPGQSPERVLEQTILDTYGLTSSELSKRLAVPSHVSSRTSPGLFPTEDMPPSNETWRDLTTRWKRCRSRLLTLAQAIAGSDCSSWPTVQASDCLGEMHQSEKAQAAGWAPRLQDAARAAMWHTMHGFGNFDKTGKPGGGCELGQQAAMWQTAISPDSPKTRRQVGGTEREPLLPAQAETWPTPASVDGEKQSGSRRKGDRTLPSEARAWPTPNVPSGGRAVPPDATYPTNCTAYDSTGKKVQVDLNNAASRFSPPAPATSTDGGESSPSRRRLNPLFVEWLMGFPSGWSDCECSATQLSHFKRRMHSCLCGLLSRME